MYFDVQLLCKLIARDVNHTTIEKTNEQKSNKKKLSKTSSSPFGFVKSQWVIIMRNELDGLINTRTDRIHRTSGVYDLWRGEKLRYAFE